MQIIIEIKIVEFGYYVAVDAFPLPFSSQLNFKSNLVPPINRLLALSGLISVKINQSY